jgi:cysteine-S-conjugate beta-lyase
MYNFDELIDRHNKIDVKWNRYADKNVIPLWIADMDFKSAPPILEKLKKITQDGVLGYSQATDELIETVAERLKTHHNWTVKKEWILPIAGLVPGIYAACRIAGKEGDSIITSTPVYTHLVDGIKYANREIIDVPLVNENGNFKFNFSKIRESITPATKMLLLCNPHNPTGRVFSREELQELLDICLENNIIICSDEIHCDLILDDSKKHISIGSMSQVAENQTITLLSPSKTFNIAGLGCSFAIIPNDEIRRNFIRAKHGMFAGISPYALEAALVAYQAPECEIWRDSLLHYLKNNHDYLLQEINQIKGMKMAALEATYLAWIDVRELNIPNIAEVLEKAGVGVMDAKIFHGKGFIRLNFGTQKVRLEEAVRRIKVVLNK